MFKCVSLSPPCFPTRRFLTRLPSYSFTRGELSARPDLIAKLVPSWYAETLRRDQDVDVTNFVAIPLAELRLKEA